MSLLRTYQQWFRTASGFRRFGLKAHDLFATTPVVKEAVARLEPDVFEQRYRRLRVAFDLSMKHDVLIEHVDPNEVYDEHDFYLDGILDEVQAEEEARKKFFN